VDECEPVGHRRPIYTKLVYGFRRGSSVTRARSPPPTAASVATRYAVVGRRRQRRTRARVQIVQSSARFVFHGHTTTVVVVVVVCVVCCARTTRTSLFLRTFAYARFTQRFYRPVVFRLPTSRPLSTRNRYVFVRRVFFFPPQHVRRKYYGEKDDDQRSHTTPSRTDRTCAIPRASSSTATPLVVVRVVRRMCTSLFSFFTRTHCLRTRARHVSRSKRPFYRPVVIRLPTTNHHIFVRRFSFFQHVRRKYRFKAKQKKTNDVRTTVSYLMNS